MNIFRKIFANWKIAKRLAITLFLILLFRLGTLITVPGVSLSGSEISQTSFIGIMDLLGGGGITRFSIFAMGVTPYITASVIIQLLSSDVVPYLSRLKKQGEKGSIKSEKITRVLTIFISIVQSLAVISSLQASGRLNLGQYSGWIGTMALIMIMVAGSIITLWIADQITISGVGNGTSLLILVGIVGRAPSVLVSEFNWFEGTSSTSEQTLISTLQFILYLLFTCVLIWAIAYFETSRRKLPIQQTGQGLNLINDKQTFLPLKINPAGVIPVIFASSIISLPGTIAQFFSTTEGGNWVINNISLTSVLGVSIYAFLLVFFTFFYAHININSTEMAENFQKSSTFIIGVKPGEETSKYISKVVTSVTVMGATVLTILAIMPYVLTFIGIPRSIAVGGTSMIILVSVAMETWEQLQARIIAVNTTVKQKEKTAAVKQNKKSKIGSETILFD